MTLDELAGHMDQTLLRPDADEKEVTRFLEEAGRYPFASVCIPPCYVPLAFSILKGSEVKVGTVIGFPLGYQTTATKGREAEDALEKGAEEIDMVMNISAFRSGDHHAVSQEIRSVRDIIGNRTLKVIIEACYLSDDEKRTACDIVVAGGSDYVKTSTGFGPGGATVKDVELLTRQSAGRIRVKASGGIKTLAQAASMIHAGADRIGTSSGVSILQELVGKQ